MKKQVTEVDEIVHENKDKLFHFSELKITTLKR